MKFPTLKSLALDKIILAHCAKRKQYSSSIYSRPVSLLLLSSLERSSHKAMAQSNQSRQATTVQDWMSIFSIVKNRHSPLSLSLFAPSPPFFSLQLYVCCMLLILPLMVLRIPFHYTLYQQVTLSAPLSILSINRKRISTMLLFADFLWSHKRD